MKKGAEVEGKRTVTDHNIIQMAISDTEDKGDHTISGATLHKSVHRSVDSGRYSISNERRETFETESQYLLRRDFIRTGLVVVMGFEIFGDSAEVLCDCRNRHRVSDEFHDAIALAYSEDTISQQPQI
jgi:hypothetical protein